MRHRDHPITLALALVIAASTGGCVAKTMVPATQSTALGMPATQPAPPRVPIVYSSYFKPERLNDAQLREIDAVIAEAKPKAGEPWFVYVRYSRDGTYRVSAYFRPTSTHGHVRRGNAVFVDNEIPLDQRRRIVKQLGDAEWPTPHQYVQVATQDSDQGATPPESNLPFSPPDGISDDELIKVVGIARTAATKDDAAAAEMPVRNVEVGKDGTVRVFFGWQAGGLNGRGVFVEVKREGAGFAEPSVGMWVS